MMEMLMSPITIGLAMICIGMWIQLIGLLIRKK